MALLDERRDLLVVRIVYDGPPFSGKTTTLRALAAGIGQPLETPEAHDGRTLFFDWVDYTAGRFDGRPIRCQVVSVPGQRSLVERRRRLLADADAVVFVADTGSLGLELSTRYAGELLQVLAAREPPRPGVVVQANKRDVEDALDMSEIVDAFRDVGLEGAFIESRAQAGEGVREAFLFGVRLALDRVRELIRLGRLRSGSPHVDSSADLLAQLTAPELDARLPGGEGPPQTAGDLPDPRAPSGLIWPPVAGRVILQQALAGLPEQLKRTQHGDLRVHGRHGWELQSRQADVFADQDAGRSALMGWARLHVRNAHLLSEGRCLVLSRCTAGWRLWQLMRRRRSVLNLLKSDGAAASGDAVASCLVEAAGRLLAAAEPFSRATIDLPLNPGTVAADTDTPCFVGFMPGYDAEDATSPGCPGARPRVLLAAMLGAPAVRRLLASVPNADLADRLDAVSRRAPQSAAIAEMLKDVLTSRRVA